jgi:hypothetical protein
MSDGVGRQTPVPKEVKVLIIGNYVPMLYEILLISAAIVIGGYLIALLVHIRSSRTEPATKTSQQTYERELAGTAGAVKCDHCGNLLDASWRA